MDTFYPVSPGWWGVTVDDDGYLTVEALLGWTITCDSELMPYYAGFPDGSDIEAIDCVGTGDTHGVADNLCAYRDVLDGKAIDADGLTILCRRLQLDRHILECLLGAGGIAVGSKSASD